MEEGLRVAVNTCPSFEVNHELTPERRLLFAIIERAVRDVLETSHAILDKPYKIRARRWLFSHSKSERENPMGFEALCTELDLSAKDIRKTVREVLMPRKDYIVLPRKHK